MRKARQQPKSHSYDQDTPTTAHVFQTRTYRYREIFCHMSKLSAKPIHGDPNQGKPADLAKSHLNVIDPDT
jgi:hypothetical protein